MTTPSHSADQPATATDQAPVIAATGHRPVVVVLTDKDLAPPVDIDRIAEIAEVREATADTLASALPGADVLLVWDIFSGALQSAWEAADSLRWIHVAAAGVDAVLFDELRQSDVLLTNARGVFDQPIAEYVLACVLAHDKRLYETEQLQRSGTWKHRETTRVAGRRALVVGTGGIGRAIARLLRAVGLEVTGAGRRPRDGDDDFGTVVDSATLADHVGDIDHLVMVAPLTDATHHLLGPTELAALPDGAHVINVGRGPLVDQDALTDQIASGRLAAHLDVLVEEPLPEGDRLWTLPGVHISPHMSGDVIGWRNELSGQFLRNLQDYLAGKQPGPAVDKQRGYVSTS